MPRMIRSWVTCTHSLTPSSVNAIEMAARVVGRVRDLTLIYVTLEEAHADGHASVLRVPNSMFFQRAVRRWEGEPPPVRAFETGERGQRRRARLVGGAGVSDDRD